MRAAAGCWPRALRRAGERGHFLKSRAPHKNIKTSIESAFRSRPCLNFLIHAELQRVERENFLWTLCWKQWENESLNPNNTPCSEINALSCARTPPKRVYTEFHSRVHWPVLRRPHHQKSFSVCYISMHNKTEHSIFFFGEFLIGHK